MDDSNREQRRKASLLGKGHEILLGQQIDSDQADETEELSTLSGRPIPPDSSATVNAASLPLTSEEADALLDFSSDAAMFEQDFRLPAAEPPPPDEEPLPLPDWAVAGTDDDTPISLPEQEMPELSPDDVYSAADDDTLIGLQGRGRLVPSSDDEYSFADDDTIILRPASSAYEDEPAGGAGGEDETLLDWMADLPLEAGPDENTAAAGDAESPVSSWPGAPLEEGWPLAERASHPLADVPSAPAYIPREEVEELIPTDPEVWLEGVGLIHEEAIEQEEVWSSTDSREDAAYDTGEDSAPAAVYNMGYEADYGEDSAQAAVYETGYETGADADYGTGYATDESPADQVEFEEETAPTEPSAYEDEYDYQEVIFEAGTTPERDGGLVVPEGAVIGREESTAPAVVRSPSADVLDQGHRPDSGLLSTLVDDRRLQQLWQQIDALHEELIRDVRGARHNTEARQQELLRASGLLLESRAHYDDARAIVYRIRAEINRQRQIEADIMRYRPLLLNYYAGCAIAWCVLIALKQLFVGITDSIGLEIFSALYFPMLFGMLGALISGYITLDRHTSRQPDFDPIFITWYLFNPLLGGVMGLLAFLLVSVANGALLQETATNTELAVALVICTIAGMNQNVILRQTNGLLARLGRVRRG